MLQLNSLPPASPNITQPDRWAPYIQRPFFSKPRGWTGVRGCLLAPADLNTLQRFCLKLVNDSLVPHLERRVFSLHSTISQNRRVRGCHTHTHTHARARTHTHTARHMVGVCLRD